jgi:membrane fusion protein (multidrug efflux system)
MIEADEKISVDIKKPSKFKKIITIATLIVIFGTAAYFYIRHQELYPSTDDAYIHANVLYIAPQVSGRVLQVNVKDYQHVADGDLLVSIDPALFQVQLEKAKAAYEAATLENRATDDAILAASAKVRAADANLIDVQKNYQREMVLVKQNVVSRQAGDDEKAKLASAQTALEAARAEMSQLITEQGAKGNEAPKVKQAAAELTQATLNLSYTNIYSPHDGTLGTVSIRPGSYVSPGLAMMPMVEDHTAWVEANYKEKDIGSMKPGMTANVVLDMYPDVTFSASVESLSPASGSSFSLLPPENATGNWVKVPQRFPVRIKLTDLDGKPMMRVGASATVTVDTLSETK